MKKTIVSSIALMFAMALSASFTLGQEKKPGMDKMKMSMEEMHKSPQHMLMKAYKQNFGTFAKTLLHAAKSGDALDTDLARTLVGELRRSADKMKAIHTEHMSKMTPEMLAGMSEMMDKMKQKDAAQEEHLQALESLVMAETLNAKDIGLHAESLVGDSDKMKMKEDHKMKDKDSMKKKME